MKKGFVTSLIIGCFIILSKAQQPESINWHYPSKAAFHTVHNQLWQGSEIASYYDRLPADAQKNVRKAVWNLSRNAAGLKLVFNTDATDITVRYVVSKKNYAMNHFPATGVSGVDLYALKNDGTWAWANDGIGIYDFKDTITYTYAGLEPDRDDNRTGRVFHLYLPLYNTIEWLEIGVPSGNSFAFVPPADKKPIVVYGTSITQGGCASRAGMAWTNLLERAISTPVVNLGFSGNGRLEEPILDRVVEQDAEVFILDCLANMAVETVYSKVCEAVHTIRSKHKTTPVILADHAAYTQGRMHTAYASRVSLRNEESWKAFQTLKAQGVENIYYLKHADVGLDFYDSVDGSHPTDGGMVKYAKAFEKVLLETVLTGDQ